MPNLMFVLEQSKPGTEVTIVFLRDGKQQSVNVRDAEGPPLSTAMAAQLPCVSSR